jgi:hypothetical protein
MNPIESSTERGDASFDERGIPLRDKLNDDQKSLLEDALSGNGDAVNSIIIGNDESVFILWRSGLLEKGVDEKKLDREIESIRLRGKIVERTHEEIDRREKEGPPPDAEELALGAFREAIEPQARDAVMALRAKGYTTTSSGFAGGDWQGVFFAEDISQTLQPETVKALADEGVEINGRSMTFHAVEINQQAMKDQWDKIVALIPDRGSPAAPSNTPIAESFRNKYSA